MTGFRKEKATGVVINKDVAEFNHFMSERESRRKMAALDNEVKSLKGDISEIKDLLMQLHQRQ